MMQDPNFMNNAMQMMQGMDMGAMQGMMNGGDMSMKGLMSNPDMLSNISKMLTDPKNKAMVDQMKAANPGMNIDMMLKGLSYFSKIQRAYFNTRAAVTSIYGKLIIFGLIVAILAWYFG